MCAVSFVCTLWITWLFRSCAHWLRGLGCAKRCSVSVTGPLTLARAAVGAGTAGMSGACAGLRRAAEQTMRRRCALQGSAGGAEEPEEEVEIFLSTKRQLQHSPQEEERLEREHFWKIINAYRCYGTTIHERVNRTERQFRSLPDNQQNLLPDFFPHLDRIRQCIDHNQEILEAIVEDCIHMFENKEYGEGTRKITPASTFDMDKLKSTIKQFIRDWSEDGRTEREACYQPIINEIVKYFPRDKCDVSKVEILVPGAGLGRLAWEIANLGYACQGNEWSFFMLFSSNFVLNRCSQANAFKLYPWIHQFSNNRRSADQIRPVYFPDINPHSLPSTANFSMTAGDFQEIYTESNAWHCIATCFFIDTAHNIIDYIETIWKILKPGGIWVNLGPLLYHFENLANELSIELSYEDIKNVILQYGFHIEIEHLDTLGPKGAERDERLWLLFTYQMMEPCAYKTSTHSQPLELRNMGLQGVLGSIDNWCDPMCDWA